MSDQPTEPPESPQPSPRPDNLSNVLSYYRSTGEDMCPQCGSANVGLVLFAQSTPTQSPFAAGVMALFAGMFIGVCVMPLGLMLILAGLAMIVSGVVARRKPKAAMCHCNHCGVEWER